MEDSDISSLVDQMEACVASVETAALNRMRAKISQEIQRKSGELTLRLQIMRLKYDSFSKWMDMYQIFIILISSATAVTESVKGELNLNNRSTTSVSTYHAMQLLPVFTSTLVSFLAAVVKFKKFGEKMEALGRAIEKSVIAISRMNKAADQAIAMTTLDQQQQIETAFQEAMEVCADTLMTQHQVLAWADIVSYLPSYHALSLRYMREEQSFEDESSQIRRGDNSLLARETGIQEAPSRTVTRTVARTTTRPTSSLNSSAG